MRFTADAARLFCLALEKAAAGSVLQAVADEGLALKGLAEKIGQRLQIPARCIADEDVNKHFGWLSRIVGADLAATRVITPKTLDWQRTHNGLLDDFDHDHYFDTP